MSENKRSFPYASAVESFEVQRRRLQNDPSREYVEPKVYQAREQADEYEERGVSRADETAAKQMGSVGGG